MRLLLPLVVMVMVSVARAALGRCWERPSCQELNSENNTMDCFQLCGIDPHELTTILASVYPQPSLSVSLSPSPSPPSSSQTKASYSMKHFRWGNPLRRKRRPLKIYTGKSVDGITVFPGELGRLELSREQAAAEDEELSKERHDNKDILYKMKHFRWSSPAADKRYGGFMKSWKEHSKRPLITLFRNVIKGE
ncbi:PREDICTED: pro-opiomelanocortin-like [Cyprinodon variegatus]|uniref:pro-opiomelanocortin-like n=1 Tax=Cyprinodon variegatus TaxID=28743 RepID=UPI000742508A|nr:PREDICTED: pro-opiomelanocortin-like [Cyprinodon variegatus]